MSRAVPGLAVPSVSVAALDPGSTRLVYAMVAGLVLVGIVFIVLGVWLVRQTRYDPPVLAPLERMGDADWRKRDEATQRRILDEVRPEGAVPLRTEAAPPDFDTEFDLARRAPGTVSDLGPGVSTPTPPPPPQRPRAVETAADVDDPDRPTDEPADDRSTVEAEQPAGDEVGTAAADVDDERPDEDAVETAAADDGSVAEEPEPEGEPAAQDDGEPEPESVERDDDEAPERASASAAVTEDPPDRD